MMERYKAYKESELPWLRTIPEHWEVKRIKDIFTEIKEVVGERSDDYTLLSLSTQGVIERDIVSGKGKFPKEFDSYKIVNPTNLVFCLFDVDETPRTVGYVQQTGMLTGAYDVFSVSNANTLYVYYYFIALDNEKSLKPLYRGLRKVIPMISFMSMPIYLPPLEEQQAIAEYLDRETVRIDRIVELLTKQRECYAQLKRSLISEVVTHGLPHHNPANYRTLRLKDICIINPSYTGNLSDNEQVSFFPMENIKQGYFINDQNRLLSEVKGKYTYCANGDIVMAKITPSFENGNIALLNGLTNGIGFGSSELIPFRPSTMVDPTYLLYFLQTDQFKNKAIRTIKGVGGLRRIDIDDLKVFPISLPPLEEQQEIVAYLDERCKRLDRLVEAIDRKIDLLGSLKKSLIEEVVTGQRRITN
ncbi:restriction endonuclease subunit S [Porphyromonas levii]|uniref:restriction endonuclease subunit S n=1 Tax=Porphyromonas levii TaxID=28114 RepID=UPI001BA98D4F|nr:restriction endonuclease subunit S [Porphyromonas levii]MBR8702405.1 hypothetical protein [Porphyromonas levii]